MEKSELYKIIGKNIKRIRTSKEVNLTQEELAELTDLSVSMIRNLESEKFVQGLSINSIYRISIALNKSVSTFMKENDNE